jgi:mRNA degradation ribonuclease J1/J2
MSELFREEDIEDQAMHNWLDHFKLQLHQMHASGYMSKEQSVEIVNYIQPKIAFPVHTEKSTVFQISLHQHANDRSRKRVHSKVSLIFQLLSEPFVLCDFKLRYASSG